MCYIAAMNIRLLVSFMAVAAMAASAYWAPRGTEEMATESDCVVIGRIIRMVPNADTNRLTVTMDRLQVLKGSEHAKGIVTFDAPAKMSYCFPTSFDFGTNNETCAVFLKFAPENDFKLSVLHNSDGKIHMDVGVTNTLEEFRKKVESAPPSRLSCVTLPVFYTAQHLHLWLQISSQP